MTKNEFKIGDRVRIKAHPSVNPDYVGRICEVASVSEGAYIAFKDCDSYWNPEVLELVDPLDRKTAFLTELQALLRKYNAFFSVDAEGTRCEEDVKKVELAIFIGDERMTRDVTEDCIIEPDNIMDFDKE